MDESLLVDLEKLNPKLADDIRAIARCEKEFDGFSVELVHQGKQNGFVCQVVPYLLIILEHEHRQQTKSNFEQLVYLALGGGDYYLPYGYDIKLAKQQLDLMRKNPPPPNPRILGDLPPSWKIAKYSAEVTSYEAVEKGVPLFVRLLDCISLRDKIGCVYLLAWFPYHSSIILPKIREIINWTKPLNQVELLLKASCILTLGQIGGFNQDLTDISLLKEIFNNNSERIIQITAAIGLTLLQRENSPIEFIEFLIENLETTQESWELNWSEESLPSYIFIVLSLIGSKVIKYFDSFCRVLEKSNPFNSCTLINYIFLIAFPKPYQKGEKLNEIQKKALISYISMNNNEKYSFLRRFENANNLLVLHNFGIPVNKTEWDTFLVENNLPPIVETAEEIAGKKKKKSRKKKE